jgi:hypothetical protein
MKAQQALVSKEQAQVSLSDRSSLSYLERRYSEHERAQRALLEWRRAQRVLSVCCPKQREKGKHERKKRSERR